MDHRYSYFIDKDLDTDHLYGEMRIPYDATIAGILSGYKVYLVEALSDFDLPNMQITGYKYLLHTETGFTCTSTSEALVLASGTFSVNRCILNTLPVDSAIPADGRNYKYIVIYGRITTGGMWDTTNFITWMRMEDLKLTNLVSPVATNDIDFNPAALTTTISYSSIQNIADKTIDCEVLKSHLSKGSHDADTQHTLPYTTDNFLAKIQTFYYDSVGGNGELLINDLFNIGSSSLTLTGQALAYSSVADTTYFDGKAPSYDKLRFYGESPFEVGKKTQLTIGEIVLPTDLWWSMGNPQYTDFIDINLKKGYITGSLTFDASKHATPAGGIGGRFSKFRVYSVPAAADFNVLSTMTWVNGGGGDPRTLLLDNIDIDKNDDLNPFTVTTAAGSVSVEKYNITLNNIEIPASYHNNVDENVQHTPFYFLVYAIDTTGGGESSQYITFLKTEDLHPPVLYGDTIQFVDLDLDYGQIFGQLHFFANWNSGGALQNPSWLTDDGRACQDLILECPQLLLAYKPTKGTTHDVDTQHSVDYLTKGIVDKTSLDVRLLFIYSTLRFPCYIPRIIDFLFSI